MSSTGSSTNPAPRTMSLSTGHPTAAAASPALSAGSSKPNADGSSASSASSVSNAITAQPPLVPPAASRPSVSGLPPRPANARDPVTAPQLVESSTQRATHIPNILPHERVFPIQIGSELFKLSGASLSSDAPSYFSQYFQCQIKNAESSGEDINTSIRTLYIDRDPATFRDISLHLQGYHVQPRDGTHFVRLFADAQFYSLPRLISQLYEESIFMSIGHREFQIPRDLFQAPGNLPNYFSLGFAIFFSSPDDLFPGLDREGLIRPPSILPPQVPGRSAETFAELLHLLRGYPVEIRNDAHRQTLLRDCRYFNFKGLEQKLIPHRIAFNQARQRNEITLRIEDVLKSGVSVLGEPTASDSLAGWVNYARPYVDDKAAELVLEIGAENTKLIFFPPQQQQQQQQQPQNPAPQSATSSSSIASPPFSKAGGGPGGETGVRAEFFRDTKTRVARLFEVIATKLSLPPTTQPLGLLMAKGGASSQPPTPGNTPLSDDLVRVVLEPETSITLDGEPFVLPSTTHADGSVDVSGAPGPISSSEPSRKRRRADYSALGSGSASWVVKTGQWRLRIQAAKNGKSGVECVLVGVKLDAVSSELARNQQRGFL